MNKYGPVSTVTAVKMLSMSEQQYLLYIFKICLSILQCKFNSANLKNKKMATLFQIFIEQPLHSCV